MIDLFIHLGLPKTGSSAIQRFFAVNGNALQKRGIYYPHHEAFAADARPNGGNIEFYDILNRPKLTPVDQRKQLLDILLKHHQTATTRQCHTVVFSAESLSHLNQTQIDTLVAALPEDLYRPQFILCTREPFAWYVSSWLQGVKRGGIHQWLDSYLQTTLSQTLAPLEIGQRLRAADPQVVIQTLDYDDHPQDLIAAFLKVIGLSAAAIADYDTSLRTNRSINAWELALIFTANRFARSDPQLNDTLSQLVDVTFATQAAPPLRITHRAVKQQIYDFCESKNLPVRRVPDDGDDKDLTEAAFFASLDGQTRFFLETLKAMHRFYTQQKTVQTIDALLRRHQQSAYRAYVPDGFRASHYLLMHPDLLQSGHDPYAHYCLYGQFEGRRFRLSDE